MPQEIKFQQGETSYLYDASGVKLRVKHKTANSSVNIPLTNTRNFEESEFLSTLTTDYIGNKVYEDGKLKMILNPEGYTAYYSGYWGTESKTNRYHIKDYLGSVRVVLDNSESTEQLHYYAFGMPFSNRNLNSPYIHPNGLVERFKYIGKEFDSMHGLDTYDHGARQYDGMRWPTMDLLAEKYYSISPYVYCANNPIRNIDLRGDSITVTNKQGDYLFMLDDGTDKMITYTAQQLYSRGIQWFASGADNYMPLIGVADNLSESTSLKHFTSEEILTFSEKDRWMIDYRSGGSGDWKKSEQGANGYLLVTVDGKPYWADAVGQVPFTINKFRDEFLKTGGNGRLASERTIDAGRKYGDGNPLFPQADYSNGYDNAMIQRTVNWASKNYFVGYNSLRNWVIYKRGSYNPSSLFNYR